eukprot:7816619-Pyramimonas_sp.AAC.1
MDESCLVSPSSAILLQFSPDCSVEDGQRAKSIAGRTVPTTLQAGGVHTQLWETRRRGFRVSNRP